MKSWRANLAHIPETWLDEQKEIWLTKIRMFWQDNRDVGYHLTVHWFHSYMSEWIQLEATVGES